MVNVAAAAGASTLSIPPILHCHGGGKLSCQSLHFSTINGTPTCQYLPRTAAGASGSAATNLTTTWRCQINNKMTINNSKHRILHGHRSSSGGGGSSSENIVTFSSTISTDIPLYEPPGVSFDDYIFDRPRVFRAMFPDARRSKRLNDEEWEIQMLPIQFLFASVNPVVVMRLRHNLNAKEYPPGVPDHATRVLDLQATRWELRGLEEIHMPSHFALTVQGVLYADRSSKNSRLKGHLEMGIGTILPPVLRLVPEDVLSSIANAVLRRLLAKMKREVDGGVIADYAEFRREKLMKRGRAAAATVSEMRGSS